MNSQISLTAAGTLTFIGQLAFAMGLNGLGMAASAAALPMLLPMLVEHLRRRAAERTAPYCAMPAMA